jgi:hypothetical protein
MLVLRLLLASLSDVMALRARADVVIASAPGTKPPRLSRHAGAVHHRISSQSGHSRLGTLPSLLHGFATPEAIGSFQIDTNLDENFT